MKKIISVLLAVIMLVGTCSFSVAAQDTQGYAYDEAENFAFALDVVSKSTYAPDDYLTRAEFSELVYRLLTAGEIREVKDGWQEDNFGEDTKDQLVVLGDTKLFEDVDAAVPQYDAIKYMTSNGYMKGMTDTLFGPSYDITVASAAKVMVSILGYEAMAIDKGGFPGGYMSVAATLKLLGGIKAGANDFITTRECLTMFYNALDVRVLQLDYISGEGDAYLSKGEDTFLEIGLGIAKLEGIVTDTGITTLYGSSKVGEEMAVIDGTKVKIGSCKEIRNYIGREVYAYCKIASNGTYTLLHIEADENDALTFASSDFVSYTSGTMKYSDENGKIKTEKMVSKSKMKVVYNGKALSQYTTDIFSFPYGDITLVATEGSLYDLVVIRDYSVGKVTKIGIDDQYLYTETLYKSMNSVKYVNLGGNKVVEVKDASGKDVELGMINPGNVVSVMQSKDSSYIEVIVSNAVVYGFKVSEIAKENSDIIYIDGETEYSLSHTSDLVQVPAIKIGKAYNMYLDHEGRLVYIDAVAEDTSEEKAAFITGVDYSENGFDEEYKIRLYTEEGLMVTYDFAERVIFNGDSRKTEEVIAEIKSAGDAQKAVLYSADAKTKIMKTIILPLEFGAKDPEHRGWYHISPDEARLSLYEGENATDTSWKNNISTYGMKWAVNGYTFGRLMFWDKALTRTMSVPSYVTQYGDERNFMVSSGSAPFGSTDEKFLVHGYSRDAKAMAADLLVYASAEQGAEKVVTTSFFVLEKLTNALDRNGESVMQLTGYEIVLSPSSCKKVSYTVDDNTYFSKLVFNQSAMSRLDPNDKGYDITVDGPARVEDLQPGDILRFSRSGDGVIRSLFVNYDESQDLYFCRAPITNGVPFDGEMNIAVGYPLYVTGTYVRMADTDYLPEELEQNTTNLLNPAKLMAHNVGGKPIVVVEKIGNRTVLRQGTMADITTYDDTGIRPKYERVAGVLYGGLTIGTVVYKVVE